ncbi:MarR family winged helix-turn-helix transcriptional regulator [Cohnella nanjingensis]|uniref:MarR family winged helix-turn-helix transcriptional regulator n=1 Tax=Cohnella nanjingensis TaxID=1387779 RepID=UPI001C86D02A|nr:MarR family transcriptional regulator [Cohnella nanjingensis]
MIYQQKTGCAALIRPIKFYHDNIGIDIHEADLAITNYVKRRLAPFRLAPEQNLIMLLLWQSEGVTQNEIADSLGKDKAGVARMILSLESKGYVKRIVPSCDRRTVQIFLTPEGQALKDRVLPVLDEIKREISAGIGEDRFALVRSTLSAILANVERASRQ